MIDLDGARGRGFSNSMCGSAANLREELLTNLRTGLTLVSSQQQQNTNFQNDLLSSSSDIIHYYVNWPTYVMQTIQVSQQYALWWATHGKLMQMKLSLYLDQLTQLDNILKQKGK